MNSLLSSGPVAHPDVELVEQLLSDGAIGCIWPAAVQFLARLTLPGNGRTPRCCGSFVSDCAVLETATTVGQSDKHGYLTAKGAANRIAFTASCLL